ncbi:uncharacterized protein LOC109850120 [Asparagus officinalis]|uniref:uncharacterized protein LOC109850120 n=1 Tax=Asparagus officinalis TaxID=4686 RepID=UPI00098DF426|nr:uncharacterized protein LOC109850120 [Asparagus officinalis]
MASRMNSSIPDDIGLSIASLLEVPEVCSLGSCSKFWYDLCSSDPLWLQLTLKRWPHLNLDVNAPPPLFQGWKRFYISKHKKLARCASVVIKFVEDCTQNESLEVGNYLKAINDLRSIELGFKDVQMFLLARKHNVVLNLIGLHYCVYFLGISPHDMMEALRKCQVFERQVCVNWFKLGRWFYGFRLPDEHRIRRVALGDLAVSKGEEVLCVLNRGAVHEVLRVQITSVKPAPSQSSRILAYVG